jgi:hypothetical protein
VFGELVPHTLIGIIIVVDLLLCSQGVHSSSTVNIHMRAQKGYYLEQACTKCTYKRHIAIKHEVDIHEAGDKAIEKYM